MKKIYSILLLALSLFSFAETPANYSFFNTDKTIKVEFNLTLKKTPSYKVFYKNRLVINTSSLGIVREDANFYTNMKIVNVSEVKTVASNYSMLQGKRKNIHYAANEYIVSLQNKTGEALEIIFQLSHDGIALRYHFPKSSNDIKKIMEEKTTYNFDTAAKAWLQPMSKAKTGWKETNPSYEEHYAMGVPVNTKPAIGEGWVYPALFNANEAWVLITETGLQDNYCGSRLVYNDASKAL